jgi:hypothetical protein
MPEDNLGCSYREREDKPPCNKVCDAGEALCPHHLLLQSVLQTQYPPKRKPPAPAPAPDGERRWKTPRGYDE